MFSTEHSTTQSRPFYDLETRSLFKNIERKGENVGNQHFLLFPRFLSFPKQISISKLHLFCNMQKTLIRSSPNFSRLVKSNLSFSSNKPGFLRVCNKSFENTVGKGLLKTQWEKEKLLVTSNFSFSHFVFYSCGDLSIISSNLK